MLTLANYVYNNQNITKYTYLFLIKEAVNIFDSLLLLSKQIYLFIT